MCYILLHIVKLDVMIVLGVVRRRKGWRKGGWEVKEGRGSVSMPITSLPWPLEKPWRAQKLPLVPIDPAQVTHIPTMSPEPTHLLQCLAIGSVCAVLPRTPHGMSMHRSLKSRGTHPASWWRGGGWSSLWDRREGRRGRLQGRTESQ